MLFHRPYVGWLVFLFNPTQPENFYAGLASTYREGSRNCLKSCLLSTYKLEIPPIHIPSDLQRKADVPRRHSTMFARRLNLFQTIRFPNQNVASSVDNTVIRDDMYFSYPTNPPGCPTHSTPCSSLWNSKITVPSALLYCLLNNLKSLMTQEFSHPMGKGNKRPVWEMGS